MVVQIDEIADVGAEPVITDNAAVEDFLLV